MAQGAIAAVAFAQSTSAPCWDRLRRAQCVDVAATTGRIRQHPKASPPPPHTHTHTPRPHPHPHPHTHHTHTPYWALFRLTSVAGTALAHSAGAGARWALIMARVYVYALLVSSRLLASWWMWRRRVNGDRVGGGGIACVNWRCVTLCEAPPPPTPPHTTTPTLRYQRRHRRQQYQQLQPTLIPIMARLVQQITRAGWCHNPKQCVGTRAFRHNEHHVFALSGIRNATSAIAPSIIRSRHHYANRAITRYRTYI